MRRALTLVAFAICGTLASSACEDRSSATRGALLAIGDPAGEAGGLPGLPAARREVEAIAGLFRSSGGASPRAGSASARVLVGDEASKSRLSEWNDSGALRRFRFIHFATHATQAPQDPGEPALVLSPCAGARDEGLLTAAEVRSSWRLDADLVVLGACRSAGRLGAGGSSSLAEAFLAAGARSVVVSLWDVDDDAAELLMIRFYQLVLAGISQEEALAGAKAWLRSLKAADLDDLPGHVAPRGRLRRGATDETDQAGDRRGETPFSHPSFWAGFVLVRARD